MNVKQSEAKSYPDRSRFPNRPFIHYLLICITGLIIYSNTFNVPFQWDENIFIQDNPIVKNLHYFSEPSSAKGFQYYDALKSRYIGYLTFALNYKIHGFHVTGYHILNISIHLLNALLVYYIVILTFGTPFLINSQIKRYSGEIALLSSLFFVSHPVQTEAVTYIFQRLASLVTMFYLFSIVMYIKARIESQQQGEAKKEIGGAKSKRKYSSLIYYAIAVVSAILAMKTKENAFTLPIVAVLYELFFFKGPVKKRLLHLIPLLLTLFIIPLTLIGTNNPAGETISQAKDSASAAFQGISREDYLFTQFRVIVTYIRLLFLPINQNLDYDYPIYHSFLDTGVLLSFLLLSAIICFGVYLLYRSRLKADLRLISFGIFWFFMTLSVESSVIPIPMVIDEYRVYLPSVGVFVAVISGMFLLIEKFRYKKIHTFLVPSFILLLIVFSIAAYERNSVWVNRISLWEDVVKKSPDKARVHVDLGLAYKSKGLLDKAIEQYQIALNLKPDYAKAHLSLGDAYESKGLLDKAIEQYQMALNLKPDLAEAHNSLGHAYKSKGLFDKAIEQYRMALDLKPDLAEAHYNLGNAYQSGGLVDKAIEQYQMALNLRPDLAEAHNNLGIAYKSKGLFDRAIEQYQMALDLKPDYAESHLNLGVAYASKGLFDKAIEQYQMALNLRPDLAEAHNNLGVAYASKGLLDKAIEQYQMALDLKPDYANAHLNLGIVYLKNGAVDGARREFESVLKMKPDDYRARQALSRITK